MNTRIVRLTVIDGTGRTIGYNDVDITDIHNADATARITYRVDMLTSESVRDMSELPLYGPAANMLP